MHVLRDADEPEAEKNRRAVDIKYLKLLYKNDQTALCLVGLR